MKTIWIAIGALALPLLAQAAEADWLRCAELRDGAARLACYDALVARLRQPGAAPALRDAAPVAPAAPAAAARTADPVAQFGQPAPRQEVDAIESRILGLVEGWEPGQVFVLENGQRWFVADGSSGVLALRNPKVTVRRGALGTFRLEFEGSNSSARVKRLN